MKTGLTVLELGLYATECCDAELIFDIGDTFSRCPKCQHLCEWEFEYELTKSEELDGTDQIAA